MELRLFLRPARLLYPLETIQKLSNVKLLRKKKQNKKHTGKKCFAILNDRNKNYSMILKNFLHIFWKKLWCLFKMNWNVYQVSSNVFYIADPSQNYQQQKLNSIRKNKIRLCDKIFKDSILKFHWALNFFFKFCLMFRTHWKLPMKKKSSIF